MKYVPMGGKIANGQQCIKRWKECKKYTLNYTKVKAKCELSCKNAIDVFTWMYIPIGIAHD